MVGVGGGVVVVVGAVVTGGRVVATITVDVGVTVEAGVMIAVVAGASEVGETVELSSIAGDVRGAVLADRPVVLGCC